MAVIILDCETLYRYHRLKEEMPKIKKASRLHKWRMLAAMVIWGLLFLTFN